MQFKQHDDTYFVYLEKGDTVIDVLTDFCKDNKINNGYISGIGAVNNIELGSYDSNSKTYIRKTFDNDHELINCQGNIMILDGDPFIHVHVTISNHNMETFGGHLFKAKIAVVGEFIIRKIHGNSKRSINPDLDLATWDLE